MRLIRILFILLALFLTGSAAMAQVFYGKASWYGSKFHGRTTASGEIYDMNKLTAAHKNLPFGTVVRVTNLDNGKAVTVRVIDRGPFVQGRILDLSRKAAEELDFIRQGVANIKMEVVDSKDQEGVQAQKQSEETQIKDEAVKKASSEEIQARPEEEKESDISDQDTIDSIISALKTDTGKGGDQEVLEGTPDDAKKQEKEPEQIQKQSETAAFDESKMKEEEIPLTSQTSAPKFEQRTYQIFVIQLGAFSSEQKAQAYMKKLEEKGLSTYITSVEREKQVLYKVRDKRIYRELNQVLEQAKQIKAMGLECFVIGKFFVGS